MRIVIAAIGKLKRGPETELCARYRARFDGGGRALGFGALTVHEMGEARDGNVDVRRGDEAARLLAKVSGAGVVIALDEKGVAVGSNAFAGMIGGWRDAGRAEVAFLIGGPDGHGEAVFEAADKRLSLGAMTLPHGLARAVLFEQLYRAQTILAGHPYHRA